MLSLIKMFPLLFFFVFFLLPILLFLGFILKLLMKTKNDSWTGEVIDKKYNRRRDEESGRDEEFFTLVVKMNNGKERKLGVSKALYNDCAVNDKLKKEKGKLLPEKI